MKWDDGCRRRRLKKRKSSQIMLIQEASRLSAVDKQIIRNTSIDAHLRPKAIIFFLTAVVYTSHQKWSIEGLLT